MIDERQVEKLRQRLRERWKWGVFHFDTQDRKKFPRENRHYTLNAYVETLGFRSLEDSWLTIERVEAFEIVVSGLYVDRILNDERMTLRDAALLALEIIELFPSSTYYYTHPSIYKRQMNSPLTNALFDAGVAFMSENNIGIFWVTDDD